jgi:hypothetical protein
MNSGHHHRRQRRLDELAALASDAELLPKQGLRSSGSKRHDHLWLYYGDFGFEPSPASFDFVRVRLLVDASFPLTFPLEMLHRIGYVGLAAIDASEFQSLIEQPSSRTYEWFAFEVFIVTGLLTDKHYFGVGFPLAEDCLRCIFPKRTCLAIAAALRREVKDGFFGTRSSAEPSVGFKGAPAIASACCFIPTPMRTRNPIAFAAWQKMTENARLTL